MKDKRIGFIGLGAMGKPMAKHLVAAGYPLCVYDLKPDLVDELVEMGAKKGTSPADAAKDEDVVITILPADDQVKAAVLGMKGVLETIRPGAVLIDMTSLNPHTSIMVAGEAEKKGVKFLDAPVSGGTVGAEKAALTIMIGGDKAVLEAHRDIFETMGKTIFHMGGVGMGETVKMINQLLVGVNIMGIAEAFVLGAKLGADPQAIYEVIRVSAGNSFLIDHRVPNYIFKGDFSQPGFALDLLRKDVGLALDAARTEKLPLFMAAQVYQLLSLASSAGMGNLDFSSVIEILEEKAGVRVRVPS